VVGEQGRCGCGRGARDLRSHDGYGRRADLYAQPGDSSPPTATIPYVTSFVADSSVVVVRQFGLAVVDKPVRKRPSYIKDSSTLAPVIRCTREIRWGGLVHVLPSQPGRHCLRVLGSHHAGMIRPRTLPAMVASSGASRRNGGCAYASPTVHRLDHMTRVGSVEADACSRGNYVARGYKALEAGGALAVRVEFHL